MTKHIKWTLPTIILTALAATAWAFASTPPTLPHEPFAIHVVDAQTGRGVPLVQLRTVNNIRLYTDSNGIVAFRAPGLMNKKVFFHISTPGYTYPEDGFGYRGKTLLTTPGGSATIKIHRTMIAQRLYRVTGQGIYADSALVGAPIPIEQPLLNAGVVGQDSVQAQVYRGKIYWFWGDTNYPDYPLGNFHTSGAVSKLPSRGGLNPAKGVNLHYFTNDKGWAKAMLPLDAPGVVWIDGLMTVSGPDGQPRLVTHYTRLKGLGNPVGHGLAVFNDKANRFVRIMKWPDDAPLHPRGHAFKAVVDGQKYIYFAQPYPFVRVEADWQSVTNPYAYEGFTCLEPGSRRNVSNPNLDRNARGELNYAWKRDTAVFNPIQNQQLIQSGAIEPEESWLQLRSAKTGERIILHRGSVHWNAYRDRYIMIAVQHGGDSSFLGEIWYSEAERPRGPWEKAVKIVTHSNYSFYNPTHHAFFDQKGGRIIYFEGTYSHSFSGADQPVPQYDYNQIMYRLDLSHPRIEAVFGQQ